MGSTLDWLMVMFYLVFWGGGMLAWETRKRKAANVEPSLLPASILIWVLAGLEFGLVMTFKWKAFQSPLVLVTAASFLGSSGVAILCRHERSRAIKLAQGWWRVLSFFLLMAGLVLFLVGKASAIAYLLIVAAAVLYLLDHFHSGDRESPVLKK